MRFKNKNDVVWSLVILTWTFFIMFLLSGCGTTIETFNEEHHNQQGKLLFADYKVVDASEIEGVNKGEYAVNIVFSVDHNTSIAYVYYFILQGDEWHRITTEEGKEYTDTFSSLNRTGAKHYIRMNYYWITPISGNYRIDIYVDGDKATQIEVEL